MYDYYLWFLLLLFACMMFSASASNKIKSAYSAFNAMPNRSGMTGYDTAVRLLRNNGVTDITVHRVRGFLSDHYHPTKRKVNLSESVYGNPSVGAVAVAAHEIGHVMQKKTGYVPYRIRTMLVPVCNFGSKLALPLVLLGLVLDFFVINSSGSDLGYSLALIGVAMYGLSTLFMLVTLPVEYNASARARRMLVEEGILTEEEALGAKKVLDAAALTYVASLATSLVYFLRFAMWVFMIFGGRRRD